MSEEEKNVFEKAMRSIVTLFLSIEGKDAITKFMALGQLMAGLFQFYNIVKGWERDALATQIKVALDGMVGTESDALLGPKGSVLTFDTGYIDVEKLTDLIFESAMEAAIAA